MLESSSHKLVDTLNFLAERPGSDEGQTAIGDPQATSGEMIAPVVEV